MQSIAPAFTRPTFARFDLLLGVATPTVGRRAVSNLLRTASPQASGHITTYWRVRSSASWSAIRLA